MDRFHNEWGEAKNFRSRKPGESDYVPVEQIPDEGNDPESLLIAREEDGKENNELSDMRQRKKFVGPEKDAVRLNVVTDINRGGQSSQRVEGLRKAVSVKGGLGRDVTERRSAESEKRGKGSKLNKSTRDKGEFKKAA